MRDIVFRTLEEEWNPAYYIDCKGVITDYSDSYEVSNHGRVRSLDRIINNRFYKGKLLKTHISKNYCAIRLNSCGKSKNCFVHRLVLSSFSPNTELFECINHKDCCTTNNNLDNLEWCSVKYNSNYGDRNDKLSKKLKGRQFIEQAVKKAAEKNKKAVGAFKDGKLVEKYDSAADACRLNSSYNFVSISAACNGRISTYRGYIWRFI